MSVVMCNYVWLVLEHTYVNIFVRRVWLEMKRCRTMMLGFRPDLSQMALRQSNSGPKVSLTSNRVQSIPIRFRNLRWL